MHEIGWDQLHAKSLAWDLSKMSARARGSQDLRLVPIPLCTYWFSAEKWSFNGKFYLSLVLSPRGCSDRGNDATNRSGMKFCVFHVGLVYSQLFLLEEHYPFEGGTLAIRSKSNVNF